jgi:tRNA modification GTPase
MHDRSAPIIAIATAPGRGAVGIVRISGPRLVSWVQRLCERTLKPREATLLPLKDAQGQAIDQVLALYFPAPHSYTGEDVLELQAHGGPIVLQLLVARCLAVAQEKAAEDLDAPACLPGLRLARAGEFTERAFLNQKLDLAQAEAVADLIDASTALAARSASRSLAGAFSEKIHGLRDALIDLRMLVEATLDFPEEDIDFLEKADARGQLDRLQTQLQEILQRTRQGALLREGIRVVIAGQPNAGKSSLLNALAGAELAIVTPIAGTTRDVVSQSLQIDGVPLHVVDTAGLRPLDHPQVDEVEKIGIARAWEQIRQADAVVFLHDLTRAGQDAYQEEDARIAATLQRDVDAAIPVLQVWNKADAVPTLSRLPDAMYLSAKTGSGLADLRARLLSIAGWQAGAGDSVFIARERHVQALARVTQALHQAHLILSHADAALDLLAEELRQAQNALGEITGEFSADDLLGVIFSRFCIGK